MRRDHRTSQQGFTVLEALVAIAVLGLVAVGMMRLLGETAVAAQRGAQARERAALADALWQLVRLDAADPEAIAALMPEGFAWDIERLPYREPAGADSGSEPAAPLEGLVRVRITVRDPEGGSFLLQSLEYRP